MAVFRGLARLLMVTGLVFAADALAWAMGQQPPASPYDIRVAIAQDQPQVVVTVRGDYRILALRTADVLQAGGSLRQLPIAATPDGLQVGSRQIAVEGIRIQPLRDAPVDVDRRRVRGVVEIIRQPNATLLVVNHVGLEAYLYGMLRHEASQEWPMEALKAQAIVSRTYALDHSRRRGRDAPNDFDVTATVASQVYGGRDSERWRTSRAVSETYGLVLTYDGRIFPAYFHAACGGHTEAAAALWRMDLPPLRGVACPWCHGTPHDHWTREIMQRDLAETLRAHGAAIERISAISVTQRTASGRAARLRCEGPGGPVEVTAKELREWLGSNWLKSLLFDVRMEGYKILFEGRGWGHGVGMCQWGAAEQARRGRTTEEILQYYYPGAMIQRLPAGLTAPPAGTPR